MKNIVNSYVRRFRKERRRSRRVVSILLALALLVSMGVTWQLHSTGIAMTNETFCGQEEHTHTEECYGTVLACGLAESEATEGHTHTEDCYETQTVLVCGLEESEAHTHSEDCYSSVLTCGQEESEGHTHDESCYTLELTCGLEESEGHTHTEDCYETVEVLICSLEECEATEGHTHTDACYETQLICGLEEHTHTIECLVDETADVETAADWEATIPDLTGNWAEDVVAIAESQLGYTESTANYTLADDGETHKGYTRYGAWYGNKYGDWCAMFASFCLHYAGVPESEFPEAAGVYAWIASLNNMGLYAEDCTPSAGDLVFFDNDSDGAADHVGIITEVNEDTNKITVIEGNCSDAVMENTYSLSDSAITGFGLLPEQETEEAAETETYTAEADGVTVTVTAPVGALPEDAELTVTILDAESEAYAAAAEAVGYDAEDEDTGMAALDIAFYVGDEEVEPTQAVTVAIDASNLLPEEADAETIEVNHLEETEEGIAPVLVADATEDTAGTVDAETVVAEFEVDGFSTFTLQWSYTTGGPGGETTYNLSLSATPYIYDTSTSIGTDTTLTASSGTAIDLTSSNSTIGTITYNDVAYKLYTATVVYDDTTYSDVASITVTRSQSGGGANTTTTYIYEITYTNGTSYTFYSGSSTLSSSSVTISLYYKYASSIAVNAYLVSNDNSTNNTSLNSSASITSYVLADEVTENMEDLADQVVTSSNYTYSYTTVSGDSSASTISNVTSITYNNSNSTYTVVAGGGTYTMTSISSINMYYINTPSVTISSTTSSTTDDDGNTVTVETLSTTTTNMESASYSWSFTGTGVDGNALTITGNSTSGWTVTDINGDTVATIADNSNGTATVTWTSDSSTLSTGGTIVASVTATGANGGTATDSYSMIYGKTSSVKITVQYPSGTTTDAEGNTVTTYSSVGSNVTVTIYDTNGNTVGTYTTDSNGQITANLVDGADYVVSVSYTRSSNSYTYYGTITADATNGNTVIVSRVYTYYHIDLRVAGTFSVTVTEGSGQTDVTITKVWNDEGYENSRPSSITVSVKNSSRTVVKTLTLTAADGWTYVWKNVDLEAGTYTVTDSLDGYTTAAGSFTIADENTETNATTSTTYTGTITVASLSSLVVYKNGDLTSTPIEIEMQAGTSSDENASDTEFKSVAGHGTNGNKPTSVLEDYVTLENGDVIAVTVTYTYSYKDSSNETVTGTTTKTIYVTVDENANICDGTAGDDEKQDYGFDFVISASDLVDESDVETEMATITNTYSSTATTNFTILKVDGATGTTTDGVTTYSKTLSGAEFTLTQSVTTTDETSGETTTTVTYYNASGVSQGETVTKLSVSSDGKLAITGLANGTYTLTEVTAPDGYNLLSGTITLVVANGSVTPTYSGTDGNTATVSTDASGNITLTVTNSAGYELPSTGGMGTWLYTLAGVILCGGAALVLYRRKRLS